MSNDEQCRRSIEGFIQKKTPGTSLSFVDFLRCLPKSICTSKRNLNMCINELRDKYQLNSILCSRLDQLKQQIEINFPDESSKPIGITISARLISKVTKIGKLLTEKYSNDHIAYEMDRLLNDMRKLNYSNPDEFKLACDIEHYLRHKIQNAPKSIVFNNILLAIRILVSAHSLPVKNNLNNLNRVLKRIITETPLYDKSCH